MIARMHRPTAGLLLGAWALMLTGGRHRSVDLARYASIGSVGRAGFWWDDRFLHLTLDNSKDTTYVPLGPDEAVCVSLLSNDSAQDRRRGFTIYVQGPLLVEDATVNPRSFLRVQPSAGQLPDPNDIQIEHAVWPSPRPGHHPWQVKLHLAWTSLTDDGRPPRDLTVQLYRVVRERPFSTFRLARPLEELN